MPQKYSLLYIQVQEYQNQYWKGTILLPKYLGNVKSQVIGKEVTIEILASHQSTSSLNQIYQKPTWCQGEVGAFTLETDIFAPILDLLILHHR